jgi:DNA-binding GntR family transcriptional regulator
MHQQSTPGRLQRIELYTVLKRYTKIMTSDPPSQDRSDLATARLRADIIDEVLAPGAALAEATVARRLGVSRVPVREALFTLEREGLVGFTPTGRAYVKALDARDFNELYIMRLTLEPAAARLAAATLREHPETLLANVAETARAKSILDVTRLDLEFHQHIMTCAGNARLLKAWLGLRWELGLWLGRLHRLHERKTRSVRTETVRAHSELIALFRTQSPAACEGLMRRHILGWHAWLPGSPTDAEGR